MQAAYLNQLNEGFNDAGLKVLGVNINSPKILNHVRPWINNRKIGFPVVHIETDFISPLKYGDTVHATIWIEKIGTKSCSWAYRFHNQNNELLWSSSQVTVCVDMDTMKSVNIPNWLSEGLEKHIQVE